VAVPILAATVVLTDELWVKPLERRHEMEAVGVSPGSSPGASRPGSPGSGPGAPPRSRSSA
jgi:hypothetical protein